MRAKYLYEWFPPVIEEELDKVTVKRVMDDFEAELLRNEIGIMMFGDEYNIDGSGNAMMKSRDAGFFGAEVRNWRDKYLEVEVTVDDIEFEEEVI